MIKYTVSTSLDAKTEVKKVRGLPWHPAQCGVHRGDSEQAREQSKMCKRVGFAKEGLYFSLWTVVNTLLFLSSYSRILETVQNYAPLRSKCLLRPITHTTPFFWKCQFSWWIHPLFSKAEKRSPVSALQKFRDQCSAKTVSRLHI